MLWLYREREEGEEKVKVEREKIDGEGRMRDG